MKKNYSYYVWVGSIGHFIEVTETGFHDFIMFLGDSEVSKVDEKVTTRLSQIKYYVDGEFLAFVQIEVVR